MLLGTLAGTHHLFLFVPKTGGQELGTPLEIYEGGKVRECDLK
jgi:hypothetical protein